MAIPALTAAGYLPAGEHLCTLDEVQQSFATNEHREALLERLHAFLDWLVATESLSMPVYVDGSFTTNKPKPSDVDVVMDLAQATNEEIGKAMRIYQQHDWVKEEFSVDYYPYFPALGNDLREYFKYIRVEELQQKQLPKESRKGLLRIEP